MQRFRALPMLALAALAACGNPATAPTDDDLVGTWSLAPASGTGVGMQQMTVHFGDGGAYTLERSAYGGAHAEELVAYDKTVGSVSVEDGALHFHPTGSVSWSRQHVDMPLFDAKAWQSAPLSYTVEGDHLVLRFGKRGESDSMVLTRRGQ